jgi:hypothetical protein
MSKMMDENFNPKTIKIKNILQLWKMRNLTPMGRVTVVKTLVLPIITHLLTALPNPILEYTKSKTYSLNVYGINREAR